jgi:hypothetical protein
MGIVLLAIILIAVIGLTTTLIVRRGPFRQLGVEESVLAVARSAAARIALRNVVALLAAISAAVVVIGSALVSDLGRTLFMAPLLTAAVGIAFFVIVPAFHETGDSRTAELSRRRVLSFASRRALLVTGALALSVVAACISFGLVAEPDGHSFNYQQAERGFGASPFPGFYYGVPVLVALAILATVSVVAIMRVIRARMPGNSSLREADAAIRQLAVGVILRAAAAGCATTLGGILFVAGAATSTSNWGGPPNSSGWLEPDPFVQGLPVVESLLAAVFIVAGIALAIGAVTNALRKPLGLTAVAA